MLDVHEVRPDARRHPRPRDVVFHQALQLVVGDDLLVAGDFEFRIQQRMPESHARLQALARRAAKPARVRELEADQQIVRAATALAVRRQQRLPQPREAGLVGGVDDELVRIGAAFRAHGHRLAAPDEFGAAFAEPLPATQHRLGDAARRRAVPSFHRLHGPAITDDAAVEIQRLGQCRSRAD